jgi:hypothetical protein
VAAGFFRFLVFSWVRGKSRDRKKTRFFFWAAWPVEAAILGVFSRAPQEVFSVGAVLRV